jgi:hypothetical protein
LQGLSVAVEQRPPHRTAFRPSPLFDQYAADDAFAFSFITACRSSITSANAAEVASASAADGEHNLFHQAPLWVANACLGPTAKLAEFVQKFSSRFRDC